MDKVVFTLLSSVVIFLILTFCTQFAVVREEKLNEYCEYAFFMGQYTALQGDVRIDTTTFKWTKSPWFSKQIPIFDYGVSELGKEAQKQIALKAY